MNFYLIDGANHLFQFPVNPEEIHISRQKGYETITMLQHGEFDFAQGEKVKEITFSSFFPKDYDSSYCRYENIPEPSVAMNTINSLLTSKKPVQFMITGTPINVPVFVIAHNTTLRGGDEGDIYFEITLRTWREPRVSEKATSSKVSVNKGTPRSDLKEKKKTYSVKSGDSLSKIAKLELGDSSKWKDIYKLNTNVIGSNPNAIKVGQKLVMP
ncbi:LysM peptidoglycan-binding domain-containing protein [Paenibacillus pini]|uniref:LysM peptidoglycan-binding domain-containing protein n=1 Tax=Paenibacillus pini TaxID=669461 RepID=UPI00056C0D4B